MRIHFIQVAPIHLLPCITLALISGIMWAHFQGGLFTLAFLILTITVVVYTYSFPLSHKKRYNIILSYLAFFAGIARYKSQSNSFDTFYKSHSHIAALKAQISEIAPAQHKLFKWLTTLEIKCIQDHQQNWLKEKKFLQVYTCKRPSYIIGDMILVEDLHIKKPSSADFVTYLKKEKITATLFMPCLNFILIRRPPFHFGRILSHYKQNIVSSLQKKLSFPSFSLFSTIFLGKKSKHMQPLKQNCKIWGISHYLARSGLHLLLFILIWHFLLGLTHTTYRIQSFFLIFVGGVYYLLSWSSVSFNRAFFAFLLNKISTLLLLPINTCHILTLVCFSTLLNNPYHLFFLDFQLSFSLAFAISYFNELYHQRQQYAHLKISNLY